MLQINKNKCNKTKLNKALRGFSLVELAIVLVIIAVIAGGVISANKITQTAKINSLISEINQMSDSKNKFKDLYGFYPGDMPQAESGDAFGTSGAAVNFTYPSSSDTALINQLGDDRWGNAENTSALRLSTKQELRVIWDQLNAAGFVNFKPTVAYNAFQFRPGTDLPKSTTFGNAGVGFAFIGSVPITSAIIFANVLRVGKFNDVSGASTLSSEILNDGAFDISTVAAIDTKIDETNTPLRGRFFVTQSADLTKPCYSAASPNAVYLSEKADSLCTANYAEYTSDNSTNDIIE
jgi:prepilin-type N-terminal cleavage/methylation domain-containing protein